LRVVTRGQLRRTGFAHLAGRSNQGAATHQHSNSTALEPHFFDGQLQMGSHRLLPEASAGLYRDMMTQFLGPVIMRAFDDPDVTEVYTNPHDQRIWLITHSAGRVNTGESIDASSVLSFLNTVATSLRTAIGADHPDLQAELPVGSHRNPRLQGLIPPIVEGPCFVIRKHAPEVYSIDRLVDDEVLGDEFADILRQSVAQHWNVLVVGGPRTGKTTLANAILNEMMLQFPQERIVMVEDTIELQCGAADHLALRVREGESLAEPVKKILRLSPDRIVVGEVRDHAAFYMLDAWLTGSPGSLATLHGSSPENALLRLDLLCQRAGVPSQLPLIAAAVQLVVETRRAHHVRPRVVDVARVEGLDAAGRVLLTRVDSTPGRSPLATSIPTPDSVQRRWSSRRTHRSRLGSV
jgi:type IV secretion system protein TrbB